MLDLCYLLVTKMKIRKITSVDGKLICLAAAAAGSRYSEAAAFGDLALKRSASCFGAVAARTTRHLV